MHKLQLGYEEFAFFCKRHILECYIYFMIRQIDPLLQSKYRFSVSTPWRHIFPQRNVLYSRRLVFPVQTTLTSSSSIRVLWWLVCVDSFGVGRVVAPIFVRFGWRTELPPCLWWILSFFGLFRVALSYWSSSNNNCTSGNSCIESLSLSSSSVNRPIHFDIYLHVTLLLL
jgi:hypothetical protein